MAHRICAAQTVASLRLALVVPEADMLRELVNLNDWIRPLNVLDGSLEAVLLHHPSLVVVWDGGHPPKPRVVPAYLHGIFTAVSEVRAHERKGKRGESERERERESGE